VGAGSPLGDPGEREGDHDGGDEGARDHLLEELPAGKPQLVQTLVTHLVIPF
jgi:hypothetical protein